MSELTDYLRDHSPALDFTPGAFYSADGNCIFCYFADAPSYAEWVNEGLTLYKAQATGEIVGCQINRPAHLNVLS